ncbi:hypothetical protein K16_02845, partial [Klebsiella pneumoniae]
LIHLQFFLHGYIAPRSRDIPQEALIHVNIYFALYIVKEPPTHDYLIIDNLHDLEFDLHPCGTLLRKMH